MAHVTIKNSSIRDDLLIEPNGSLVMRWVVSQNGKAHQAYTHTIKVYKVFEHENYTNLLAVRDWLMDWFYFGALSFNSYGTLPMLLSPGPVSWDKYIYDELLSTLSSNNIRHLNPQLVTKIIYQTCTTMHPAPNTTTSMMLQAQ